MAQIVGASQSLDRDGVSFGAILSATGFGSASATKFVVRAPGAFMPDDAPFGAEWEFGGTDFANFSNGFPATGTITSLTYRIFGPTVATITGLNLSVTTFFNLLSTNQFEAINDLIYAGDDTIILSSGGDFFYGRGGNDLMRGLSGNDVLNGGVGNDTIEGGDGDDLLDLESSTFGEGNDRILGGAGNDRIFGWSGSNFIDGGEGNDEITSMSSSDTLLGGAGFDFLNYTRTNSTASFSLKSSDLLSANAVTLGDGTSVSGFESYAVSMGSASDTFNLDTGLSNFATFIIGGGGNDTFVADFRANTTAPIILSNQFNDTYSLRTQTGAASTSLQSIERLEIFGGSGSDTLAGGDGNDVFDGGLGNDSLIGGGGSDLLRGGEGNDQLIDTEGEPPLLIQAANDTLDGGAGNDVLVGASGRNTLLGGLGNDTIVSGNGTSLAGVFAIDTIDGGEGIDQLSIQTTSATANLIFDMGQMATATGVNLGNGTNIRNIELIGGIIGGSGDDTIIVNADSLTEAVQIDGRDGNDRLIADFSTLTTDILNNRGTYHIGQKSFIAFVESAQISGGSGNDVLTGFSGGDVLNGNDGADTLVGGAGADTLDGGAGFDLAGYRSSAAGVTVYLNGSTSATGDASNDVFRNIEGLEGSGFADKLGGDDNANIFWGGEGNDQIFGLAGNDTLIGGMGVDTLDGGTGFDFASYQGAANSLIVYMGGGTFNTGDANGDVQTSIEGLIGSNFADVLGGNEQINELRGMDGNDWMYGQAGNDTLLGGAGNDVLSGGLGADRLEGGNEIDVAFYRDAKTSVKASLLSGGTDGEAAGDTYFDVENIWGSDFDDVLTGNNGAGQVYGFAGNDNLSGLDGDDFFYGGVGSDTMTGGAGIDSYFFLSWNDKLNQFGTPEPYEGGDVWTDFTSGTDRIILSRFWFGFGNIGGPAAALTETHANFVTNGVVGTNRPSLIWNANNRTLSFDADGNGATQAVLLGTLQQGATLALSDIWTA